MTVKELIDNLRQMPQDEEVHVITSGNSGFQLIADVELKEESFGFPFTMKIPTITLYRDINI